MVFKNSQRTKQDMFEVITESLAIYGAEVQVEKQRRLNT